MKKMKRYATLFIAGIMAAMMAVPSFASGDYAHYQYNTGSTEIVEDNGIWWASGHTRTYPGWAWIDGYCYYFTDRSGENKLTNCVTPDGYTVDAEGRWTVDGIPQSNGYGSFVIGTDTLYANKNDDERWEVMRDLYENLFANYTPGDDDAVAMMSTGQSVFSTWTKGGLAGHSVIHNSQANYSYLHLNIANSWNDGINSNGHYQTEKIEKMLKIACGDHAGQELFDDIRKAAEPANGGEMIVPVYDENGNWIWIDGNHVLSKTITNSGDGVDFSLFDLAKWNGRKTDYGKTIEIVPATYLHKWELIIK